MKEPKSRMSDFNYFLTEWRISGRSYLCRICFSFDFGTNNVIHWLEWALTGLGFWVTTSETQSAVP